MSQSEQANELPIAQAEQSTTLKCCSWSRLALPTLGLVTMIAVCVAAYFAGRSHSLESRATALDFPVVQATASVTSEKFSMATGMVGDDAEGLFVLDHNSGLLQCNVIYPRMGQFLAQFRVSVPEALGVGAKGGSYMMVTGLADFPRASNRPAGACVVYVMDTTTGNYAAYGIPFDRAAVGAGRQQLGALVLIGTGTSNPVVDRDNLR
jgi:hypothetical protein